MASPIIKIEDLNFYYDYQTPQQMLALKHIDLEIGRGEYVVFFGPSGCGKTTLVYLVAGITTEKSGTGKIEVNDHDVLSLSAAELAVFRQTGIGIIFQQFNLIPSLTIVDNVALPMTFIGIGREERRARARELLQRLNMDKYAERFPAELSGGQQQRAGIARALANDPPIVIADEPLGNLDSENAEHVLKFLKELQEKDGRTIIMVTHEAWSVRDADRIIYMKDGGLTRVSEPIRKEKSAIPSDNMPLSPGVYKELHPDMAEIELMVKALSNLILRGFSADEIKRFQFFLGERLSGKIDAKTFQYFLDLPYREDGVGLWKQRAAKIADLTEDLISEKKKLTEVYAALEKDPGTPISEEIHALREWILREYKGKVESGQAQRLDEAISKRLRGATTPEEFRNEVNLGIAKGGAGFSFRTTEHISERLESALALGHAGSVLDAIVVSSGGTPAKNT